MVRSFIDTENGTTFNGDSPYVFWFDEGQSVNLFYVKRIAFLSTNNYEDVSIEQGGPFKLIPASAFSQHIPIELSNESYYDINDLTTYSFTNNSNAALGSTGLVIHMFYIIAFSETAGEFTCNFTIGQQTYTVGADFYNEDEVLGSNLENLGVEIPKTVQKAIYETNVHEEATDNITMNRKWKELLLEYWNIFARKGSYKSLVSSMKWFEYGDLVRILEYWKREDVGKRILLSNDIEQILSDIFREQLSVLTKTTYIGLYLALEKPSATEHEDDFWPFYNSNVVYSVPSQEELDALVIQGTPTQYVTGIYVLNENNPVLYKIASQWSVSDLFLKMTLVGNFFSTYFMPVHLDLIHSTVEDIIFTNTMKIFTGGQKIREDWINLGATYKCDTVTDGSNWYMQPVDCIVGPMTVLGLKDYVPHSGDTEIVNEHDTVAAPLNCPTVLGYNDDPEEVLGSPDEVVPVNVNNPDLNEILFSASNRYDAYGAPVKFHITVDKGAISGDFIKAAQIHWNRNGSEQFDYRDAGICIACKTDTDTNEPFYDFTFNLLFEKSGKYDLSIIFESAYGVWYCKKFTINVIYCADNHISIYKIRRGDVSTWKDTVLGEIGSSTSARLGIFTSDPDVPDADVPEIVSDVNEFRFSAVNEFPEMTYAQFIHANTTDFTKAVGLNHVIMFPKGDTNITGLRHTPEGGAPQTLYSSQFTLENLKTRFPHYWWFIKNTETWLLNNNNTSNANINTIFNGRLTGNKEDVVIGIRKYFTTEGNARVLAEKELMYKNVLYRVVVTQTGRMITVYTSSSIDGSRVKVMPFKKRIDVDLFGVHTVTLDLHADSTIRPSNGTEEDLKYGSDGYRLKILGACNRLVDEDRFVPLFHQLEPITSENYILYPGESAIAVPHFTRTQQDSIDDVTILFKHCGTAKNIDWIPGVTGLSDGVGLLTSGPTNTAQLLGARFEMAPMRSGFYDAEVRYKYNGEWQTEKCEGAFKIL